MIEEMCTNHLEVLIRERVRVDSLDNQISEHWDVDSGVRLSREVEGAVGVFWLSTVRTHSINEKEISN